VNCVCLRWFEIHLLTYLLTYDIILYIELTMVFQWCIWSMSVVVWLSSVALMTSLPVMTSSRGDELRLAVIVPFDERRLFSRSKVLPAVRDALGPADDATHRRKLVPGYRWVVFEADSGCSGATAPIAAIDMHYQQQVWCFSATKIRRKKTNIL